MTDADEDRYFVVLDDRVPGKIQKLLRLRATPGGPISEAFSWRLYWKPSSAFVELEHNLQEDRLKPITREEAEVLEARFRATELARRAAGGEY